jgi:hypothetical protein
MLQRWHRIVLSGWFWKDWYPLMIAEIIEIGHSAVMLPMAGAIAAWLIAGRAWKMALCWCVMFAAGLSLVALSKIAFLGWAVGIPSLDFKALSGHAFRATAVIPVLLFVVLQGTSVEWRTAGVIFGIAVSVGLGVLLVLFNFHTVSGFQLRWAPLSASASSIDDIARPRINRWNVPLSMIVFM